MAVPSYGRCGLCMELKPYPLIKVPLGPAELADDEVAEESGLPVKSGYVQYSSFCLKCARIWLSKLTEPFLTNGSIVEPEVEPIPGGPVEPRKKSWLRRLLEWATTFRRAQ